MSEQQQEQVSTSFGPTPTPIFAISVITEGVVSCEGTACDSECPIHGTNATKTEQE